MRVRPSLLLVATASLGLGFGLTLGSISTYAGAFQPQRRDVALTALNVLLGLGTALSPLLVAVFLDIGKWWYLPLGAAVGFVIILLVSITYGRRNERLLTAVESGYYPSVELSGTLLLPAKIS